MKNQKFFFSLVAVLFVLGVFVLFFFGFRSGLFAKVGAVGLTPKQLVVAVDRHVAPGVVGDRVVNGVTDKTYEVALNAVNQVVTSVRVVEVIDVHNKVSSVSAVVERVPETVDVNRQSVVV